MPTVYKLSCAGCKTPISNRGRRIHLASNPSIKGFSSDYGSKQLMQTGQHKQIQFCHCQIQNLSCRTCKEVVGYHLLQPCQLCLQQCHNAQYYLFLNVEGEKTDKQWKDLQPILKEQEIHQCQYPEQFRCSICLCMMLQPTIILCGHSFCKRCIERHIDLNVNCPIDKKQMSRAGPFIPNRLIETLIQQHLEKQPKKQQ